MSQNDLVLSHSAARSLVKVSMRLCSAVPLTCVEMGDVVLVEPGQNGGRNSIADGREIASLDVVDDHLTQLKTTIMKRKLGASDNNNNYNGRNSNYLTHSV